MVTRMRRRPADSYGETSSARHYALDLDLRVQETAIADNGARSSNPPGGLTRMSRGAPRPTTPSSGRVEGRRSDMGKRVVSLFIGVAVVLAIGGAAYASNPNGKGGDMPAYYDGQIFTINFKLL